MINRKSVNTGLRRLRRLFVHGGVILAYHRVADLPEDPYGLAVSPAHFAQHIEYVKRTCSVMPLLELGEALRKGNLPSRAVAITFDDGYIDVIEQAYPVLKAARVPATVFMPSGFVGEEGEFWWDKLEYIFHSPVELPNHLRLDIQGRSYDWDLGLSGGRKEIFWTVHKLLMPLHHNDRVRVLKELGSCAGLDMKCRPGYRPMRQHELIDLIKDGWMQIGAHTITHTDLSSLTDEEARQEIVGGWEMLVELFDHPIPAFAYPYGKGFSARIVTILQEVNFSLACTMFPGSLEPGENLFGLNRCGVSDWPLDEFVQQLEAFFIA